MQKILKWNLVVLLIAIIFITNISDYSIIEDINHGVEKEMVISSIGIKRKDFLKGIGKPIDSW